MWADKIFSGQTFEMEILKDLHALKSPESEITFLAVGQYTYVSYQQFQKQIPAETLNLVFYICIICRFYLKHFMEIRQIVCIQRYTK